LCPAAWSGTYVITVTVSSQSASDGTTSLRAGFGLNGAAIYDVDDTWVGQTYPGIASGAGPPVQLYGGQDAVYCYANWQSSTSIGVKTDPGMRCAMEIVWLSL
jgi:hypothetical protein